MSEREKLGKIRAGVRDLAKRVQEIDPKLLLVLTATGAAQSVKSLPVVAVPTLPGSILALPLLISDGWEQQSWHDVWTDSSGWTDVWGQSPGAMLEAVQVAGE